MDYVLFVQARASHAGLSQARSGGYGDGKERANDPRRLWQSRAFGSATGASRQNSACLSRPRFGSLLQQQAHTEEWQRIYAWSGSQMCKGSIYSPEVCDWPGCWDFCAGLRSTGHARAVAVVCLRPFRAKKNFRILVALLREAATTMREMPSLLLAPFILTCSMVAVSLLFLWAAWPERLKGLHEFLGGSFNLYCTSCGRSEIGRG